jgi:hypothetical protein
MGLLLDRGVVAKYKLEITFGKNRTSRGLAFTGLMHYWLSGAKLHGGGDCTVWECPRCENIIHPHEEGKDVFKDKKGNAVIKDVRICSGCGGKWLLKDVVEFRHFKLTEQNWAHAILKGFRRLNLDADIYMTYHPEDIRYKTSLELARNRGGEEIAKAVSRAGLHIYPLKNIIIDTRNGAGLYDQIRRFINA